MNPGMETTGREPGDILFASGKIIASQLEQVRRRQKRLGIPQHRAIVDLNFASEEDTWRALAEANHLEFVDPSPWICSGKRSTWFPSSSSSIIACFRWVWMRATASRSHSANPRARWSRATCAAAGQTLQDCPGHSQLDPCGHQEALRTRGGNDPETARGTRRDRI